ncbi:MAG TPA: hypothetical protein VL404_00940 [Candidatus Eisenbacteria bacterium]|nr:hypothetical protein [Candidatus Eisenbacteria bacterium]
MTEPKKGIGGWLLVYVTLTIIALPLVVFVQSRYLGNPWFLLRLAPTVAAFAGAVLLIMRKPAGLAITRGYLAYCVGLFIYQIQNALSHPELRAGASLDPVLSKGLGLAIVILWLVYFHRSKRVRGLFDKTR